VLLRFTYRGVSPGRLPNLVTIFLGIFLEAGPFLPFGVLVSSILEVVISPERLARLFPRNRFWGLLVWLTECKILIHP